MSDLPFLLRFGPEGCVKEVEGFINLDDTVGIIDFLNEDAMLLPARSCLDDQYQNLVTFNNGNGPLTKYLIENDKFRVDYNGKTFQGKFYLDTGEIKINSNTQTDIKVIGRITRLLERAKFFHEMCGPLLIFSLGD